MPGKDPANSLFQSTRPQGARLRHFDVKPLEGGFNPRARRGRDVAGIIESLTSGGFNPRARRGRDHLPVVSFPPLCLFQSTRPQGARRLIAVGDLRPADVSIHAPAGGATKTLYLKVAKQWFQSTRPQGARPANRVRYGVRSQFQSTRPQGARRSSVATGDWFGTVSIHAPAGGATFLVF